MLNKRQKGTEGEDIAVKYLESKGYRIIQRNYRFERNEIDIIAEYGNMLVFIEVKARRSKEFGDPEDSVTLKKRARIRATAEGYLYEKRIDDRGCRFDVIAIEYIDNNTEIRHIENAF